jgi:glycosyltransferase involved in cell wall biosynthesis
MTVSLMRRDDVAAEPQDHSWNGTIELLTVGRIDREKNPMLLLDALAELDRSAPGRYRLTWVGTGPMVTEVEQRAAALDLATDVTLPGFVPFGEPLVARYRGAHAFVHVSLTEGVPAVLMEAMASGIPIVATAVGGVPAALHDGRAGLLVPPSDREALVSAIRRLDDPDLRDRLVREGLEIAARHTLDAEADQVAGFLAGARKPPRARAAAIS